MRLPLPATNEICSNTKEPPCSLVYGERVSKYKIKQSINSGTSYLL